MSGSVFNSLNIISSDMRAIVEATIPFYVPKSLREHSYGVGEARTQLLNQRSELSGNSGLLNVYPTIGDATNAPLVFHHSGNNFGHSSTVYMIPELESGIIVLGNALGHCDATDWAAEVLTEAYFCGSIRTPIRQYVIAAAPQGCSAMEHGQAMLGKEKRPSDPPSKHERYTCSFWHKTRHFRIFVTLCTHGTRKGLNMSFQGRDDEKYALGHYYQDTLVFNETFGQVVNRGQWCRPCWFYEIEFLLQNTAVDALCWRIDDTEEQGQIFKRCD